VEIDWLSQSGYEHSDLLKIFLAYERNAGGSAVSEKPFLRITNINTTRAMQGMLILCQVMFSHFIWPYAFSFSQFQCELHHATGVAFSQGLPVPTFLYL